MILNILLFVKKNSNAFHPEGHYTAFYSWYDIDDIEDLSNIGMEVYLIYKKNNSARILPVGWVLCQIVIPILNGDKIDKNKRLKELEEQFKRNPV